MEPKVLFGAAPQLCCFLFYSFLFLSFSVKSGNGLECYTCSAQMGMSNYNGQECQYFWNSYNDNHRRSQCNHQNAVCAKYIVNHEGMVWVHRSCQPPDVCQYLHARYSNPRSQLLECYTCEGNLCNGAEARGATARTAALFAAALLVAALHQAAFFSRL